MKHINLFLLFVFLLSSCTPAVSEVPTSASTQTATTVPIPTATQTPSPTPRITPAPTQIGGGSGKFIFEYYKIAYEKDFPDLKGEVNIFTSNWDGSNLTPITNGLKEINRIIRVSPDGKVVLVWSSSSLLSTKNALYLINLDSGGSDPVKLTNEVDGQAVFLDNARVAYIGIGSKGHGIYISNFDGTEQTRIGSPTGKFSTIVASDRSRVYWRTSEKANLKDASGVLYMYGDFETIWWTNLDGSAQGKLESNGQQIMPGPRTQNQYAFSPDSKKIAWISAGLEQDCSLLDGLSIWTPFIRNDSMTRNAQKTSIFLPKNSPHFGKTIDIAYVEDYVRQCFVLHLASLSDMDNDIKIPLIPPYDPANEDFFYHKGYSLSWSPDSSKILAYDDGDPTRTMTIIGGRDYYPLALYEIALEDTNPKLTLLKVISNSPMVQSGPNSRPYISESFTSFRFSPDGRLLLFVKWNPYANSYSAEVKILNLETMGFVNDFTQKIIPDAQEKRVGEIFWLP